jgi:uncharacterized protein involved in exopolysaccharide biosynthesis
MWVASAEDTVTIGIDWPDARTAFRLIQAAHENFLEARQYKEISAVSEAIGLLQGRQLDAQQKVRAALETVFRLRGPAKEQKPRVAAARPPPRSGVEDPDLQRLRSQLQSKQQVIAEMEEFRRRRIAQLASRLAELRQVFSEFHPVVVDVQQSLQQQEREENPHLATLRQEYRRLQDEYERRGGTAGETGLAAAPERLPAEALQIARAIGDELESPEIEQAKAELGHEVSRYAAVTERIEQAKLELETQRAAFNYRYGVLRPATVPTTPSKPKAPLVVGAGAFVGLLLGMLAAVLLDVRSRRVHERWQIERQLGLAILGGVDRP